MSSAARLEYQIGTPLTTSNTRRALNVGTNPLSTWPGMFRIDLAGNVVTRQFLK